MSGFANLVYRMKELAREMIDKRLNLTEMKRERAHKVDEHAQNLSQCTYTLNPEIWKGFLYEMKNMH